jgi:hypothetical protein
LIGGVSLIFTAAGLWIIASRGGPAGWYTAGLFALVALYAFAQLIPGLCWLYLDDEGFRFQALHKSGGHRWSEIDAITVSRSFGNRLIAFDTNVGDGTSAIGRVVANAGTLPDTYGMKAIDLCALMKLYAEHHDRRSG